MCVIVVTMFGSATLVSYVMIELVGRVRADIQSSLRPHQAESHLTA